MSDSKDTDSPKTAASDKVSVEKFRVWYHLPISLDEIPQDLATKWNGKGGSSKPSAAQYAYFHRPISDALWDHDSERSLFRRWCRDNSGRLDFAADFRKVVDARNESEPDKLVGYRFYGRIDGVELLITNQTARKDDPALALLIVAVSFDKVARHQDILEPQLPYPEVTIQEKTALTLADAQNALEWVRRIFPRWWHKELPGDSLCSLQVDGCQTFECGARQNHGPKQLPFVLPWVKELLAPLDLESSTAHHFGDERGYMTSAIVVDDFYKIEEGDLFRLAEADTAGKGYPYKMKFLAELSKNYFYDRHDGSIILTTHHHLCTIGSGSYYKEKIDDHTADYYRHMQFLALFEYFRLLQFSQRLTRLVRERDDVVAFRGRLFEIRQDFLDFTHLHHFSNVSLQLQPRELYSKIYDVLEIEEMFNAVERELTVATDYQARQEERESAFRNERLNKLVSFGIPLTLITGVAGMNILVGENAIDSANFPHWVRSWIERVDNNDFLQLSLISGSVFLVWAAMLVLFEFLGSNLKSDTSNPKSSVSGLRVQWSQPAIFTILGVLCFALPLVFF